MTVDHPLPSNPCDGPDPKHECSPPPVLAPPSLLDPAPPPSSSAASHGRGSRSWRRGRAGRWREAGDKGCCLLRGVSRIRPSEPRRHEEVTVRRQPVDAALAASPRAHLSSASVTARGSAAVLCVMVELLPVPPRSRLFLNTRSRSHDQHSLQVQSRGLAALVGLISTSWPNGQLGP